MTVSGFTNNNDAYINKSPNKFCYQVNCQLAERDGYKWIRSAKSDKNMLVDIYSKTILDMNINILIEIK